ncbi:hypothetical protein F4824DRAFT_336320 [Ustulina deusta]|nr:hypothetical protein F4824DRAFT_336320 [Ustulina deusta]
MPAYLWCITRVRLLFPFWSLVWRGTEYSFLQRWSVALLFTCNPFPNMTSFDFHLVIYPAYFLVQSQGCIHNHLVSRRSSKLTLELGCNQVTGECQPSLWAAYQIAP